MIAPGEMFIAYFDPESLNEICITDMKGEGLLTIPKAPDPLPVYDATPEQMRAASASVNAHERFAKLRYRNLSKDYMPPTSKLIVDPASLAKGRAMMEQRAKVKAQSAATRRRNLDRPSGPMSELLREAMEESQEDKPKARPSPGSGSLSDLLRDAMEDN